MDFSLGIVLGVGVFALGFILGKHDANHGKEIEIIKGVEIGPTSQASVTRRDDITLYEEEKKEKGE